MTSRGYVKRIWRVPKDRGAPAYLAAIVVKALVKHGWPAKAIPLPYHEGFQVLHVHHGYDAAQDFWDAVSVAARIAARTHRVEIEEFQGAIRFLKLYTVTSSGFFKEQRF